MASAYEKAGKLYIHDKDAWQMARQGAERAYRD